MNAHIRTSIRIHFEVDQRYPIKRAAFVLWICCRICCKIFNLRFLVIFGWINLQINNFFPNFEEICLPAYFPLFYGNGFFQSYPKPISDCLIGLIGVLIKLIRSTWWGSDLASRFCCNLQLVRFSQFTVWTSHTDQPEIWYTQIGFGNHLARC